MAVFYIWCSGFDWVLMTRAQIGLLELSAFGVWLKEERNYYGSRDLQLHHLLVTWAQAGSQTRSESPGALQGAEMPAKARGRATPFEAAVPESGAPLGHVCSWWCFFHTLLSSSQKCNSGLCRDLQHEELLELVGVMKNRCSPMSSLPDWFLGQGC